MFINHNGKTVKLPDFLIVGAAKSGTTSLHYYLKQHPQIFMPKVKELFFYCFMDSPPNYNGEWWKKNAVTKIDDYIAHFKDADGNQTIGEACPSYLYFSNDTIRNIKKVYRERYKDVKIIIILRNPAERAWSHFMVMRRDEQEPLKDFTEAIKPETVHKRLSGKWDCNFDYIGWGMYYEQVKAFMEEFPRVKVFLYDEFCNDRLKVMKEIFNFLGVDEDFMPDVRTKYNLSGEPRFKILHKFIAGQYPMKGFLKSFIPHNIRFMIKYKVFKKNLQQRKMPDDIKKELIRLYGNDFLKLQKLIKKDLSRWVER